MDEEVMTDAVLTVEDLVIELNIGGRSLSPVDGVTFAVARGETLGIVGESGSGKSLTLRGVLGLLPAGARSRGRVAVGGEESSGAVRIAMVFQEPMLALNPTMRVGDFIGEAVRANSKLSRAAVHRRVLELMADVGIPEPAVRARMWPHELSGGLRQRVMIAAALGADPAILLCDEPTTALDVTIQAQVLDLLKRLTRERGMAMVFVSHDLAVVGRVSDRIAVMYAGRLVEVGASEDVLRRPQHPYTAALLRCTPSAVTQGHALETIPGSPPDPGRFPPGCRFAPRCGFAAEVCRSAPYRLESSERGSTACIRSEILAEVGA
ncbi:ABC transporter ATP-binding protein [Leucobacter sp.]